MTQTIRLLKFALLVAVFAAGVATAEPESPTASLGQLVLASDNPEELMQFYVEALSFSRASDSGEQPLLESGSLELRIVRSGMSDHIDGVGVRQPNLNMLVPDLILAAQQVGEFGGRVNEKEIHTSQVGEFLIAFDPDGNEIHLIKPSFPVKELTDARVYNIGLRASEMRQAMEFFVEIIGFSVYSTDFYPPAMPLMSRAVMLVLHDDTSSAETATIGGARSWIAVEVDDLASVESRARFLEGLRILSGSEREGRLFIGYSEGIVVELTKSADRPSDKISNEN